MAVDVDPGPRCLVCGHYHGGQGSCITAHAFVARRDCPTCVAKAIEEEETAGGNPIHFGRETLDP